MTKPHEETWTVRWDEEYGAAYVETGGADDTICVDDVAKAKLLAQAPAMARLLLEHQWAARDPYDETRAMCPACTGYQSATQKGAEGHDEGCPIFLVLRAAGVLP